MSKFVRGQWYEAMLISTNDKRFKRYKHTTETKITVSDVIMHYDSNDTDVFIPTLTILTKDKYVDLHRITGKRIDTKLIGDKLVINVRKDNKESYRYIFKLYEPTNLYG